MKFFKIYSEEVALAYFPALDEAACDLIETVARSGLVVSIAYLEIKEVDS